MCTVVFKAISRYLDWLYKEAQKMMVSFIGNSELLAANMRTTLSQQTYNII